MTTKKIVVSFALIVVAIVVVVALTKGLNVNFTASQGDQAAIDQSIARQNDILTQATQIAIEDQATVLDQTRPERVELQENDIANQMTQGDAQLEQNLDTIEAKGSQIQTWYKGLSSITKGGVWSVGLILGVGSLALAVTTLRNALFGKRIRKVDNETKLVEASWVESLYAIRAGKLPEAHTLSISLVGIPIPVNNPDPQLLMVAASAAERFRLVKLLMDAVVDISVTQDVGADMGLASKGVLSLAESVSSNELPENVRRIKRQSLPIEVISSDTSD